MSQLSPEQTLRWTQNSVPLSSVVAEGRPWPALIKVARVAGTSDEQPLHTGQVLQVLGVRHRRCAQGDIHTNNLSKASFTRFGHLRPINIPVDIGWQVKRMSRPELLFPTIRDLVRHFPKKVRATYNHQRDPTSVSIVDPGTILELDRVEGKDIMVAIVRGQELKFPMTYRGDFEEIPEDRKYDFEEVMVRCLCPQWVKFIDDARVKSTLKRFQGFTGEIKLNHLFLQRVLVCRVHGSSTHGSRQVICLPLSYRDAQTEPSFFVCTNADTLPKTSPLDVQLESLYDEVNTVNMDCKVALSSSCAPPPPLSLSPKPTSPRRAISPRPPTSPRPPVPPRPEQSTRQSRPPPPAEPQVSRDSQLPIHTSQTISESGTPEKAGSSRTQVCPPPPVRPAIRRIKSPAPSPPTRPVSKYPPDLNIPPPRPTPRPSSDPTALSPQQKRPTSPQRANTTTAKHTKPGYINDQQVDPTTGAPLDAVESLDTIVRSMQDLSNQVQYDNRQQVDPTTDYTNSFRESSPAIPHELNLQPKGEDYFVILGCEADVPPPQPHSLPDIPGYLSMNPLTEAHDMGVKRDSRPTTTLGEAEDDAPPPPICPGRSSARDSPVDSYIIAPRVPSRTCGSNRDSPVDSYINAPGVPSRDGSGLESPIDCYVTAPPVPSRREGESLPPPENKSESVVDGGVHNEKPAIPPKKPPPPIAKKPDSVRPLPIRPNTLGRDVSPAPMSPPMPRPRNSRNSLPSHAPPPRPNTVPERPPSGEGPPSGSRHEAGDGRTDVNLEHAQSVREIPTHLRDLSVRGLAKALRLMKLDDVATICEQNVVDGEVFSDLSEQDFKVEPFCLKGLPLKKVIRFTSNSWRPKID